MSIIRTFVSNTVGFSSWRSIYRISAPDAICSSAFTVFTDSSRRRYSSATRCNCANCAVVHVQLRHHRTRRSFGLTCRCFNCNFCWLLSLRWPEYPVVWLNVFWFSAARREQNNVLPSCRQRKNLCAHQRALDEDNSNYWNRFLRVCRNNHFFLLFVFSFWDL